MEFAFKHVLIRDVAYATLPRGLRRDLHAATARVIEASVPDPTELAWVLAYHWREGGEPARAIEYLLAAGDRARAAMAVEETYDFYTRALELADTDADRRRIRLRRGLALADLEEFSQGRRRAGRADPRARRARRDRGAARAGAVDVLDGAGGGDAGARPTRGGTRGGERCAASSRRRRSACSAPPTPCGARKATSTARSSCRTAPSRCGCPGPGSWSWPSSTTCTPTTSIGPVTIPARWSSRGSRRARAASTP